MLLTLTFVQIQTFYIWGEEKTTLRSPPALGVRCETLQRSILTPGRRETETRAGPGAAQPAVIDGLEPGQVVKQPGWTLFRR